MNPKQKGVIIGAILGAVLGALGGYLFTRGLERARSEGAPQAARSVPPGEIVKLFMSIMGVLRGVAELGERLER